MQYDIFDRIVVGVLRRQNRIPTVAPENVPKKLS